MLLRSPKSGTNYWSRASSTLYPLTTSDKLQIDSAVTLSSSLSVGATATVKGFGVAGNSILNISPSTGTGENAILYFNNKTPDNKWHAQYHSSSNEFQIVESGVLERLRIAAGGNFTLQGNVACSSSLTIASTANISSSLEVLGETKTGSFQMTSGVTSGYYLMANDATGNAVWSTVDTTHSIYYSFLY